jgi:hypothetical protein
LNAHLKLLIRRHVERRYDTARAQLGAQLRVPLKQLLALLLQQLLIATQVEEKVVDAGAAWTCRHGGGAVMGARRGAGETRTGTVSTLALRTALSAHGSAFGSHSHQIGIGVEALRRRAQRRSHAGSGGSTRSRRG